MPIKILVVDDDDEMLQFVGFGLKTAGFEVLEAHDGREGLDMALEAKPDVMLLDLNMPVMHGFEVCRRVRADERLGGLKIIVTSAKSYLVDIKKAMSLGADRYVVKPYTVSALVKSINELVPVS